MIDDIVVFTEAGVNAPVANFSGTPTSGCNPLTVSYTNLSRITSYNVCYTKLLRARLFSTLSEHFCRLARIPLMHFSAKSLAAEERMSMDCRRL